MQSPQIELKNRWLNYTPPPNAFKNAKSEYDNFIIWCTNNNFIKNKEWDFSKMTLDQYTDLTTPSKPSQYFTNWLERKTEKCGKFRTASSYAYGLFREKNSANIDAGYRCIDHKKDKSIAPYKYTEAKNYFEKIIKEKLSQIANFNSEDGEIEIKPLEINFCRKIAYMCNPEKLLPIFKNDTILSIANFFNIDVSSKDFKATQSILQKLQADKWFEEDPTFETTQKLGGFLYTTFAESLIVNDNTIFYGPPGTGKTYIVDKGLKAYLGTLTNKLFSQAKENSKSRIDEQIEYVQFHPGYTYEDFIEGLRPVLQASSANISLEVQSGKFKIFCKKAAIALQAARAEGLDENDIPRYFFIADEINRADLARVFGDSLVCLERTKRFDFDKSGKITSDSFYIKTTLSHIDRKGNSVILINDQNYFGIPSNVYFIGTMNDTDRSIDAFDLALRRRFVWVRMGCDYSVIKEQLIGDNDDISDDDMAEIDGYTTRCEKLNDLISEGWNLGESYELGHAYFMLPKGKKILTKAFQQEIFDNRMAPLIKEYLRSNFSEKNITAKILDARDIFLIGATKQKNIKGKIGKASGYSRSEEADNLDRPNA